MLAAENFNVGRFSDAMGATTLKLGRNIPWMDLYNFAENDWPWHIFKVTGLRQMKNLMHLYLKDYSTDRHQIWYGCLYLWTKFAETCFFGVGGKTRAVTLFLMLATKNFNVWWFSDTMGAMTLKLGRIIPGIDLYNFARYDWPRPIFKVTGLLWMKKVTGLCQMKNLVHLYLKDYSTDWHQI